MSDGILLTTPEEIAFFQLAQTKAVLNLEMQGIRVWPARTETAYAKAKRLYGLKGSRENVLAALSGLVEKAIADRNKTA